MGGRLAALVALAVVAIAGCGSDDPERGTQLPPAPAGVADGCRKAAAIASLDVLCPSGWPAARRPERVGLRLYGGRHAYLLEEQEGFRDRERVFHVLFGGQAAPFPPGFEGGGRLLRVSTRRVVTPVYASPGGGRVVGRGVVELPTRRVSTTRVRGRPAAIMRAPRYPQGGIHGGHAIVMWNEDGHGYLVSVHSELSRRVAARVAVQIARSAGPVPARPAS